MIHDIFFRRYPRQMYWGERPTDAMHGLFMQVAHIIFSDVAPKLRLDAVFFKNVHDALSRELGRGRLYNAQKYDEICGRFLTERYDLWVDLHGTADVFLKERLSLIELLFRAIEERVKSSLSSSSKPSTVSFFSRTKNPVNLSEDHTDLVAASIRELNDRFRQAGLDFHYHNGFIQFAQDKLTQKQNAEPCWEILRDPMWSNVDRELKEAFDRADSGGSDAPFYAAKALESTVKIVSDHKGWTTGKERGASNYIDNLVSQKNGRFLEVWEADMLKSYFINIRNPYGHGSGSQVPVEIPDYQEGWAIETAMSWIKSLVRRL